MIFFQICECDGMVFETSKFGQIIADLSDSDGKNAKLVTLRAMLFYRPNVEISSSENQA